MSKSIEGFFDGRSDEENERIKDTLETAFPRPRKAQAAKAPKATPKMELSNDGIPRSLVEAQDILETTGKLVDGVFLMALELGKYECGAICSVADVIRDKITESIDLIELGKEKLGGETYRLGLETARKADGGGGHMTLRLHYLTVKLRALCWVLRRLRGG